MDSRVFDLKELEESLYEMPINSVIANKVLSDYRIAPDNESYADLCSLIQSSLDNVNPGNFQGVIEDMRKHNGIYKPRKESVYAPIPEVITPIACSYTGEFDMISSCFEGESFFDPTFKGSEKRNASLLCQEITLDPVVLAQVKGARKERFFRNMKAAINTSDHPVVLSLGGSHPAAVVHSVIKTGIATYTKIRELVLVVPTKETGALEAAALATQHGINVSFLACDTVEESCRLLCNYSSLYCDDFVANHIAAVPFSDGVREWNANLPPDMYNEMYRSVGLPFNLHSLPSKFDVILYSGSFCNHVYRAFPEHVSALLTQFGSCIVSTPNPAIYSDKIYAANAGYVCLGQGSYVNGSKTWICVDQLSSRTFRDIHVDWGEVANKCAKNFVSVNVQRGKNVMPPYPGYIDISSQRNSAFDVVRCEGPDMVVIFTKFVVPTIQYANPTYLYGNYSEWAPSRLVPGVHNQPVYCSFQDMRHLLCDMNGVYTAPKLLADDSKRSVKCFLYIFSTAYILVKEGKMAGFTFKGVEGSVDTDGFNQHGKVSPMYVIQCEYIYEGGNEIFYGERPRAADDPKHFDALVMVDVIFGHSNFPRSLYNFSTACFESRLCLLHYLGDMLKLPVQNYSLGTSLISCEGLVIQPRLAPLHVVSTSGEKLKSASTCIKIKSTDSGFVPMVDFSVDVYQDIGKEYLHSLQEFELSPIPNSSTWTLVHKGAKEDSKSSSIGRVPNDVATIDDFIKVCSFFYECQNDNEDNGKKQKITKRQRTIGYKLFSNMAFLQVSYGRWQRRINSYAEYREHCANLPAPHEVGRHDSCWCCEMYRHERKMCADYPADYSTLLDLKVR
jgi:hypothetical protein